MLGSSVAWVNIMLGSLLLDPQVSVDGLLSDKDSYMEKSLCAVPGVFQVNWHATQFSGRNAGLFHETGMQDFCLASSVLIFYLSLSRGIWLDVWKQHKTLPEEAQT